MASKAIDTVSVRTYRPGDDPWMDAAVSGVEPVFRHDGWTPFRQRTFLNSIAEGRTVEMACAGVGLSVASAYAFRKRANGAAFALGWAAANLLARERLADTLMTRALEGQLETVTFSDGRTADRMKYDNRLAMSLLARLDRQAEANSATSHAARLVAQEFEAFTEAIGRDDSPARAGLFLGARAAAEPEADLAPVVALARADRFARTGAAMAQEVDTSDLDLARRADWTAAQWQRAEAAGLLSLAPAAANDDTPHPQHSQLRGADPGLAEEDEDQIPVWKDEHDEWVTDFPPPDDYDGFEDGDYGQPGYQRTLTAAEQAAWDRICAAEFEPVRAADAQARDVFFGFAEASAVDAAATGRGKAELMPAGSLAVPCATQASGG